MEYHNMSIDELARQAEVDDNKLALQILDELEAQHKEALEEAVSEALQPLEEGIQRAINDLEESHESETFEVAERVIKDLEALL